MVQYGPSLRRRPLVLVSPRSIDKFQLRRKLIQAKSESYRIPTPSTTRVKQANESKYLPRMLDRVSLSCMIYPFLNLGAAFTFSCAIDRARGSQWQYVDLQVFREK